MRHVLFALMLAVPARLAAADVPYVPTPDEVVEAMLDAARVTGSDVVYDLGSGDGRIVIAAAKKYGVRAVGIEINPERITEARANARKSGVAGLVSFRQEDLFKADVSQATVVTMYLLPWVNAKLRPKLLRELKPGTRLVSHEFDMGEWKPSQVIRLREHKIYCWVVPGRRAGARR